MAGGQLPPLLLLKSPLGDDTLPVQQGTLHAVAMTAVERLSAPFEISLTAVSTVRAIDPDELLNKSVTITVRRKDGIDRYFNGIVCRVESIGSEERARWRYRLTIVPKLWMLDQTIDCRIFQQQTAQQILQTLFSEHQVEPVEFRLFGDKPNRPYTTQFDETDLVFAERIMQESGYYYFFEHTSSTHKLIVTDGNQAFKPQPSPLHRVLIMGDNVDIFDAWSETLATTYGRVQIQDYDPEKPQRPVNGQQNTRLSTPGSSNRDVYRWPAMTTENSVAGDRARFRMEAAEAQASLRSGHGFDPNICAGFRFTLGTDPVTKESDVEHTVHGVTHNAVDETWVGGTAPPQFDCAFTCFKQSVTWRDDLSIPRPAMPGIFSGIVLGDAGEDIHSDKLARIKVRLKFDHRKDTTADKSIFIRVLHAWAGNRWGWQHIPRVGSEVGVAFMNGDPDNPVCVGCFYHEENLPIFNVPAEQTKQGFKSRTTLMGGPQEYNELSFEDRRGSEGITIDSKVGTIDALAKKNITINSKVGCIEIGADTIAITLKAAMEIKLSVKSPAGAGAVADEALSEGTPPSITMTPEAIEIDAPVIMMKAKQSILMEAPIIALDTKTLYGPPPIPPIPIVQRIVKAAEEVVQAAEEAVNVAVKAAEAAEKVS